MTEKKKRHSTRTTKVRKSTTGGPGKKEADQTNWRKKLQNSRLKFDDKAKDIFLATFADTSRMMESAAAAGVSLCTVRNHIENDPDFSEAFEEARDAYRDRCHRMASKLMYEGVQKPIIGGQFKDEIITHITEYSVPLLQMELKRVEPGYKERTEIDLNSQGGGVLVAPAGKSPEQWIEEQTELNEQRTKPGKASEE